jgi:hypothetical protein
MEKWIMSKSKIPRKRDHREVRSRECDIDIHNKGTVNVYNSAAGSLAWYNVKNYGAVGDGATDDREAIQAAIDAIKEDGGGTLYFPKGTYVLSRGSTRGLLELRDVNNIHFTGDGIGNTVLLRQAGTDPGDTHGIQITAGTHISVRGLTRDGNRYNCEDADEQRHGLYIGALSAPVSHVHVEACELINMRGDGVFIIGDLEENPSYTATQVRIRECRFFDTQRSGIACQRGVRWFWFVNNDFEKITDQSIDTEASGAGALKDGWMIGNRIFHNNQGALALAVGGISPSDPAQRIVVANNFISRGGLLVIKAEDILLRDNVLIGGTKRGPLDIRDCHRVQVQGGYIEGNHESPDADGAVRVLGVNYEVSDVSFNGVTIRQASPPKGLDVIRFHNFRSNVTVHNCTLIGNGTAESAGIVFSTVVKDGVTRHGVIATGNSIKNNHYGIALTSHNAATKMSAVTLTGNAFFDDQATPTQTVGILLDSKNTGDFIDNGSLVMTGNAFGRGIVTAVEHSAPVDRYAVSGQGGSGPGGTLWWCRDGAPDFPAPNGDLAIRADGGSGTTLYVRENGTWVAK